MSDATPANVSQVNALSDLPMTIAQTIPIANRAATTNTIHLSQKSEGRWDLNNWLEATPAISAPATPWTKPTATAPGLAASMFAHPPR
jgi:hypothetical protein